jgi:hypothetical protein
MEVVEQPAKVPGHDVRTDVVGVVGRHVSM